MGTSSPSAVITTPHCTGDSRPCLRYLALAAPAMSYAPCQSDLSADRSLGHLLWAFQIVIGRVGHAIRFCAAVQCVLNQFAGFPHCLNRVLGWAQGGGRSSGWRKKLCRRRFLFECMWVEVGRLFKTLVTATHCSVANPNSK